MKKTVLLLIGLFLFAQDDQYLLYTDKLVNYQFRLKGIERIKPPFEIRESLPELKGKHKKLVKKIIKVELISIFDNKAYVMLKEYLGDQLIKVTKKWIKVGDRIQRCVISEITTDKLIIKCGHRTIIKTINKKIPFLKEQQ